MSRYSEDQLIQEAEGILGDDEHVLAAGYFALHDLVVAQIAGGATGAVGGSLPRQHRRRRVRSRASAGSRPRRPWPSPRASRSSCSSP